MNPVMRRLMREYKEMSQHPVREFRAMPLEDNMFEWHFTIRGPEDSPYAEGLYHGRVLIPTNYPFAPPDVVLITPNGRFELEKKICLSISSYHPENWRSNWGVSTVLHALRQFMMTPGNSGIGAIEYPAETRKAMAKDSINFKCPHCERSCSEDWELMKASPSATEADMTASVPPTPMMTPQNSMGSPQNSLASQSSFSGSPHQPSNKPSAAAAASSTSEDFQSQQQQERRDSMPSSGGGGDTSSAPTISPLSVGKPAMPRESPTPTSGLNNKSEENTNNANTNNTNSNNEHVGKDAKTTTVEEETKNDKVEEAKSATENNNNLKTAEEKKTVAEEQPTAQQQNINNNNNNDPQPAAGVAAQQQQQQQQQQPLDFNLPPPLNDNQRRAMNVNNRPRRMRANAPFIRRDANGRLEIQLSLELLDKLVAFTALFLGMLITYKMAVSLADPETVAGRVFDSVVQAGLDLVEG